MKLLLLICSIVVFIITAILGLIPSTAISVLQLIGVLGIGLAFLAASFLPIP